MSWITIYVDQPDWSANAVSIDVMDGDGRYEFQPGPAVGIIIGIAPSQTFGDMAGYTHAALIRDGSLKILYTPVTPSLSVLTSFACSSQSTVAIQRRSGQVTWWIDDRLVFADPIPSSGSVVLDAQLYAIGDQIHNLTYTETDESLNGDGSFSWRSQGSFEDWMANARWKLTSSGNLIDYWAATANWGYRSRGTWNAWWAHGNWRLTSTAELLDAWTATGSWGFKSRGAWEWFAKGTWGYQGSGSFTPKIDMMVANGYWRLYSTGVVEDFTVITGDASWGLHSFASQVSVVGRGSLSWTSSGTLQSEAVAVIAFHLPGLMGAGYPRSGSIAMTYGYLLRLTQAQRMGYQGHALYRQSMTMGYQGMTHFKVAMTMGYVLSLTRALTMGYAARTTLSASIALGYSARDVLRTGLVLGYAARTPLSNSMTLGYAAKSVFSTSVDLGYGPRLEFSLSTLFGYRGTFPIAVSRRWGYALGTTVIKTSVNLGYAAEPDPDMTPLVPVLTINGVAIQLSSVQLTADEDSPYWQATIELADVNDWRYCPRDAVVILTLGSTVFSLLVDRRERSQSIDDSGHRQTTVTLTAMSPLCLQTAPRRATITQTWDEPTTAKSIITELLGTVTWDMPDWPIPAYRFAAEDADPLSLARKLVEAGGGLIESAPDGSVIVRSRWPIAATQLTITPPVALLAETDILAISETSVQDQCLDRERLLDAELATQDQLEFEKSESDPFFGTLTAWLSPWREGVSLLTTRGGVIQLGPTTEVTDTITEIVTFQQGVATAQHPIAQLTGLTWLAESLGGVIVQPYATQLHATSMGSYDGYSLAEITYTTRALTMTARSSLSTDAQFLVWDISLAE